MTTRTAAKITNLMMKKNIRDLEDSIFRIILRRNIYINDENVKSNILKPFIKAGTHVSAFL